MKDVHHLCDGFDERESLVALDDDSIEDDVW